MKKKQGGKERPRGRRRELTLPILSLRERTGQVKYSCQGKEGGLVINEGKPFFGIDRK